MHIWAYETKYLSLNIVFKYWNGIRKCFRHAWLLNYTENHIFNFIIDSTCHKKCNFLIEKTYDRRYLLKLIDLTIGNETAHIFPCARSLGHPRYLYINCSSWNASGYYIQYILNIYAWKWVKIFKWIYMSLFPIIL